MDYSLLQRAIEDNEPRSTFEFLLRHISNYEELEDCSELRNALLNGRPDGPVLVEIFMDAWANHPTSEGTRWVDILLDLWYGAVLDGKTYHMGIIEAACRGGNIATIRAIWRTANSITTDETMLDEIRSEAQRLLGGRRSYETQVGYPVSSEVSAILETWK
jgi:hypothetical protein